ncbi:MAG: AI-2E family transporter, partial [Erysipelotrichia bacterium]|nr:AI-2E family transporter [Erysipelotrichia bacterium]
MKPKWSEHTTENIIALTVSGIIISIVWGILHNLSGVGSLLGQVWNALSPFLIGFCLAFIMLPIRKIAENKWLKNVSWKPKTKRRMATLIAMMVFILIVASFFIVLIPQMVSSIRTLVSSMDSYMESFGQFLDGITQDANAAAILTNVYDWIRNSLTSFISGADGLLAKVLNYSVSFVKGIFNFFIGLIVSAYILLDQENFQRQIKKVTYSLFSHGHADHIFDVLRLSSQMFSGFIFGKALDSLIIGVICYICCLIMRMPYSPLIAFTVGITNMIPFFGPFIGAIPCAFI